MYLSLYTENTHAQDYYYYYYYYSDFISSFFEKLPLKQILTNKSERCQLFKGFMRHWSQGLQVTKISLLLSENSMDIKQTANQDYINISNKRNSRYNIKTTYYQLVTFKFTIKPKCLICSNNESPVCYCQFYIKHIVLFHM